MTKYTSNEEILLIEGTQWQVNEEVFTCERREVNNGWESFIIKIESPSHMSPKRMKYSRGNTVKAFELYNTYINLRGIL